MFYGSSVIQGLPSFVNLHRHSTDNLRRYHSCNRHVSLLLNVSLTSEGFRVFCVGLHSITRRCNNHPTPTNVSACRRGSTIRAVFLGARASGPRYTGHSRKFSVSASAHHCSLYLSPLASPPFPARGRTRPYHTGTGVTGETTRVGETTRSCRPVHTRRTSRELSRPSLFTPRPSHLHP